MATPRQKTSLSPGRPGMISQGSGQILSQPLKDTSLLDNPFEIPEEISELKLKCETPSKGLLQKLRLMQQTEGAAPPKEIPDGIRSW